jgi:hypothetical protein
MCGTILPEHPSKILATGKYMFQSVWFRRSERVPEVYHHIQHDREKLFQFRARVSGYGNTLTRAHATTVQDILQQVADSLQAKRQAHEALDYVLPNFPGEQRACNEVFQLMNFFSKRHLESKRVISTILAIMTDNPSSKEIESGTGLP